MSHDYWQVEIRRLLGMGLLGLILGYLSGYWLLSLLLVSLAYIGWTLFKLRQLQYWLVKGQPAHRMPDSDGAWEQITYLIHRARQKSETRKRRQLDLLERFNNIMSALPDAAILLNNEHVIQWSNRAALELLGIDSRSDHGQRLDNLIRTPEMVAFLKTANDQEIRILSPKNHSINVLARLLPVQDNLYLLSARDISQRIHLQETRKAFFANASHELRTPLTVLSGYLELFASDPALPAHLAPAVQQSQGQAERMQQIIHDMLALARLENDEQRRMIETELDVPELFYSVVNAMQDTISVSHSLQIDIDPTLKIRGNEADIVSIITNLTENAVKHTPAGTTIRLEWQRNPKGLACLVIEDNGPGIPPQHINHLTERFYRVDKGRSRDKGGTGLGLAIVKHVMLNHNGTLDISSQPGRTRFTACFPAERVVT